MNARALTVIVLTLCSLSVACSTSRRPQLPVVVSAPAPAADPTQDELSNLLTSVGYWLQILAIYAMNSYQRGAAATTPPATPPAKT